VYIKSDAREITAFYFTIDGKNYGGKTGDAPADLALEDNSGSISGTAITVTVPYGTNLSGLAPTVVLSAGASANPAAGTAWGSSSSKSYTVTAEDGSYQSYTVTATVAPGITVTGIINPSDPSVFIFIGVPGSFSASTPITITIGILDKNNNPVTTATDWYVEITGPAPSTDTDNTVTLLPVPGFYNVNVIATVDDIAYSGSFGLTLD
jgi:hypothetical protein